MSHVNKISKTSKGILNKYTSKESITYVKPAPLKITIGTPLSNSLI